MSLALSLLFSAALPLAILTGAPLPHAPAAPYVEGADARADIHSALEEAAPRHQSVIVIFGANWCPDCKLLDRALKAGPSARLVARDFRIVKVDVGTFDRNTDIAGAYGVPIKNGIPAMVVLSPKGEVRYATRLGELSEAREIGEEGIYQLLRAALKVR
jgi:protein disulfide-isomerase